MTERTGLLAFWKNYDRKLYLKAAILADATEAVIAALYLDGGLDVARAFIDREWSGRVRGVEVKPSDPKSRVQEWAQARGAPPPVYTEVARDGPDHAPLFTIEAKLADGRRARAQATKSPLRAGRSSRRSVRMRDRSSVAGSTSRCAARQSAVRRPLKAARSTL